MIISSSVMRKAFVISRFAAKDLPLPVFPRISPLGFSVACGRRVSCYCLMRSARNKGCAPLEKLLRDKGDKIAVLDVVSPL